MRDLSAEGNPYASTGVDPTPVPDAALWRVEGEFLLVRDGAVLPDVPLFGKGEGDLVRQVGKLRPASVWSRWVPLVMVPYYLVSYQHRAIKNTVLVILIVMSFLMLIQHCRTTAMVSFSYVIGRKTHLKRRASWVAAAMLLAGGMIVMGLFLFLGHHRDAFPMLPFWLGLSAVAAGGIWLAILQRSSLRSMTSDSGWLSLRGVSKDGLQQLLSLSSSSERVIP